MDDALLLAASNAEIGTLAMAVIAVAGAIYGIARGRGSALSSLEEILNGRIDDLSRQLEAEKRDKEAMKKRYDERLRDCTRRCRALERARTDLLVRLSKAGYVGGGDDYEPEEDM